MLPLLAVVFLVVPVIEIYLIIQTAGAIGGLWTVGILLADALLGSWLVRREGARAWRRFREASASGRPPAGEALDGALVLVGGTLLVTPGFMTDLVGLVLVAPVTRPLVRGALLRWLTRRALASVQSGLGPVGSAPDAARPGDSAGRVIDGEVER